MAIKAKRLGEALEPHIVQMVTYATIARIPYCGLTDGNVCEVKRLETQDPPRQPSNLAKSDRITPNNLQRGKIHDGHNDQPAGTPNGQNRHPINLPENRAARARLAEMSKPSPGVAR